MDSLLDVTVDVGCLRHWRKTALVEFVDPR